MPRLPGLDVALATAPSHRDTQGTAQTMGGSGPPPCWAHRPPCGLQRQQQASRLDTPEEAEPRAVLHPTSPQTCPSLCLFCHLQGTGRWASASVGTDRQGKGALHDYALRCQMEAKAAIMVRSLKRLHQLRLQELGLPQPRKKAQNKDKKRRAPWSTPSNKPLVLGPPRLVRGQASHPEKTQGEGSAWLIILAQPFHPSDSQFSSD